MPQSSSVPRFDVTLASPRPQFSITSADEAQRDDVQEAELEQINLNINEADNHEEAKKNLYLYEEDMKHMPRVATFLKNFMSYHVTYPTAQEAAEAKKQPAKAKLGVVLGVYLPTIQHIFGVLMFVRLAWIVGCMGTLQSFAMVFLCCLTTFLTSISMSAIATNGVVQAGGSYFMISRNLGPECGGAVGICFYLANVFAVDLYSLGTVEIFLTYMAPELAYFGDIHKDPWNNFRVYGTVLVIIHTLTVAVGVKFVQYFAPFSLACVIVSVLSMFIGAFQASASNRDVWLCMLGERLMIPPDDMSLYGNSTTAWCSHNETGAIWSRYCHDVNGTTECDPYFVQNTVEYKPGIPGVSSGVIKDNLFSYYLESGEVMPGHQGDHHRGEIVASMTTTFVALAAIYFPSVTGIMTGSNMSGDLKDPQYSIPIGTILAQLTTSFVYLSFVLLFGMTGEGALLRDKFGHSQGGALYAAQLCWPNRWVVLVGAFCSTVGAALQCMTSAPRLLQAIARDNIIPFLDVFKVTRKNGEPIRALLITAAITELGILIANIDYVAPVIDVFFLMCYGFVNLICALQTLMKTPSWRPRYKYYHWSLSFLGVILNLVLSFTAGWYYALAAFGIAAFIYKYVEYKGGEKEWGDGLTGLSMSAAQKTLLKLEEVEPHTKNWRPQLLLMNKLNPENYEVKYQQLFSFARQLKAGKGLTLVASVIEGNYMDLHEKVSEIEQDLKNRLRDEKIKGFIKVMVCKEVTEGMELFVQTAGLGGMKPNTVMVGWPYEWREHSEERHWKVFLETIRIVTAKEYALLVPRGISNFPRRKERLEGTIDVWWIVHDGGMLILLSFLLQQNKVWKNCKLRIFTVAQMSDNSIQLKKDLENFLYQLRITADVFIEEMYDSDISAYTVERTLDMEKRQQMLAEMKLKRRGTIQEIVDASHRRGSLSSADDKNGSSPAPNMLSLPTTLAVPADEDSVHFTFSQGSDISQISQNSRKEAEETKVKGQLLRMHTAVKLNEAIRIKSADAQLVILNFPAPPSKLSAEENYMEYLDALSEGIKRVLLVRGSGREVITIYS